MTQGLVKGAILCYRNPNFYFRHGESTSTASQLTSPANQKSKDLNQVPLLFQDLANTPTWDSFHPTLLLLCTWVWETCGHNRTYFLVFCSFAFNFDLLSITSNYGRRYECLLTQMRLISSYVTLLFFSFIVLKIKNQRHLMEQAITS